MVVAGGGGGDCGGDDTMELEAAIFLPSIKAATSKLTTPTYPKVSAPITTQNSSPVFSLAAYGPLQ